MSYGFVQAHEGRYGVTQMCRVLGLSRAGYYSWRRCPESRRVREDRRLRVEIRSIFAETRGRYGSPRIHQVLQQRDFRCSRKRVARLMREEGLRARPRRRYRVTTRSNPRRRAAPNRLGRDFAVKRPNRTWAGDISFVWTGQGWLYVSVLLDLCSRKVVGWATSNRLTAELTMCAARQALEHRRPDPGLIHHSDRGTQYTCEQYQRLLELRGAVLSMSRSGDCWDNAPVESFFATLKRELLAQESFPTRAAAQAALFEYIEIFYNRKRLHSSLGYLSPQQFEERFEESVA